MRYYVTSGILDNYSVEAASPLSAAKKAVIQAKPQAVGVLVRVSEKSVNKLQPEDFVFRTMEVLNSLGLSYDIVDGLEGKLEKIDKEVDEEDD